MIDSHTTFRLTYAESKISLNNSGLETLYLRDNSGSLIDTYSYSGTQRDNVVLTIPILDDDCTVSPTPQIGESTGGSMTGSSDFTGGTIG